MAGTNELYSKILLRNDTASNWSSSTLGLEQGELAVEFVTEGTGAGAKTVPKLKVGLDGSKTFAQLEYVTMTPGEIQAAIDEAVGEDSVNSVSLASGTNNGTLKLTVDGVDTDNIAVTGLGSAAYTEASAYATAAQGILADNAMPISGGTFTGAVTLAADPSTDLQAATKQYVDTQISDAIAGSDAMVFRGTIGTDGTVSSLPSSNVVVGDTYKVIAPGVSLTAAQSYTNAAVDAAVGDLIVAMTTSKWLVVPSGNEEVTTVAYSTTSVNLSTTAQTGAITFGEAAIKQVDTTVTADSANLITSGAVKTFVEGKGYVTTDENVKTTPASATQIYLAGTTSATETTGTLNINTGVYVDTTGKIHADLDGNAATATALTSGIAGSISGGATGSASAANGGETLAFTVSALDTDYLTNGAKTLVINGGSASA